MDCSASSHSPSSEVRVSDLRIDGGDREGGGVSSRPDGPEDAVEGKKKKKRARTAAETRCQVEGCGADLSGAKPYHVRHRVCEDHAKSTDVIVAGRKQRFCQQCSRFHEIGEFDEDKRSCRNRLAGHNQRRRKSAPRLPTFSQYPAQIFAPPYGVQFTPGVIINRSSAPFISPMPIGTDACNVFNNPVVSSSPGLASSTYNHGNLSMPLPSNAFCERRLYGRYEEPDSQLSSFENQWDDGGVGANNLHGTPESGGALCLLSKGRNNVGINGALPMNQKPSDDGTAKYTEWCCFR